MRDTLGAFESLSEPGSMAHLPYRWADNDDWKDKVFAPVESEESSEKSGGYDDDRVARYETPQYQSEEDHAAAEHSHDGEECLVCAGIDSGSLKSGTAPAARISRCRIQSKPAFFCVCAY